MKKAAYALAAICLAGIGMTSLATFSRVEQMGKSDDFFLDDVSIFSNPANINLFANFLTGELGQLDETWSAGSSDPRRQWFGGAAKIRMNGGAGCALGFAFNREDELVSLLRNNNSRNYLVAFSDPLVIDRWLVTPDTVRLSYLQNTDPSYFSTTVDMYGLPLDTVERDTFTKTILLPRGRSEVFAGYSTGAGLNVGAHFYTAFQDSGLKDKEARRAGSHVYRGDVGVTFLFGAHSVEWSGGVANVGFKSTPPGDLQEVKNVFRGSESEYSFFTSARMFYDMPSIGGKLVPLVKFSNAEVNVFSERTITAGLGYNRGIEGGLFYGGLAAIFNRSIDSSLASDPTQRAATGRYTEEISSNSLRFNFGIEKNIAWDWFAVRVGGQKMMTSRTVTRNYSRAGLTPSTTSTFSSNPDDDGTSGDVIGFGIGFNFGNALMVDGTVVEQFPYKNPFSWSAKRLMVSRVSATYAF